MRFKTKAEKSDAKQAKVAAQEERDRVRGKKLGAWGVVFDKAVLYEHRIEHRKQSYPVQGAAAAVDVDGGVSTTRNRTLKTGLLHSKKTTTDTTTTNLTVVTSEGSFVLTDTGALSSSGARRFAAKVNAQSRKVETENDPRGRRHDDDAQAEILESVRDNRYTAVHSAPDLGKSFIASRAIAWWKVETETTEKETVA